jgi:hypothetical protein
VLAGCADLAPQSVYSSPVDTRIPINTLSKSLAVGMTEQQVQGLREPDRITMETCGANTPKPWPCKIYKYGVGGLWVTFAQVGPNVWLVNGWF